MVNNIQVLRAVAVYLVVIHHAGPLFSNLQTGTLNSQFGAWGVDIFFIISGFIMVFTTESRERTPVSFWQDRIVRIVPLYWIAIFCMVALSLAGFHPWGLFSWDASDLFTSLFFLPTIRADGTPFPILPVGWTLIYEMFFYFLFGLALLLRNQIRAVFLLTGLFVVLWLADRIFEPSSFAIAYYLKPLMLEFAAGCILGLLYTRSDIFALKRPYVVAIPLSVLGVAGIIATNIYFPNMLVEIPLASEPRVLLFGTPALLVVTAALILERSGARYSERFLLLQGAASYAIYLFHTMVLQPAFKVLGKILPEPMLPLSLFITLSAITAVCIVGTLVHLYVEMPISRYLRSRIRQKAAGLALAGGVPR